MTQELEKAQHTPNGDSGNGDNCSDENSAVVTKKTRSNGSHMTGCMLNFHDGRSLGVHERAAETVWRQKFNIEFSSLESEARVKLTSFARRRNILSRFTCEVSTGLSSISEKFTRLPQHRPCRARAGAGQSRVSVGSDGRRRRRPDCAALSIDRQPGHPGDDRRPGSAPVIMRFGLPKLVQRGLWRAQGEDSSPVRCRDIRDASD